MSELSASLRFEAEDCLRKAEETANAEAMAILLMTAARLYDNAMRLEVMESVADTVGLRALPA